MKYLLLTQFFADVYNCGTYGSGNYNESECTTALSSTGTDVMIGIAVGVVLIGIAVFLILKNRKKK